MTRAVIARVVVALMGVVVFGYGARVDVENLRLAGIAILAVAFLMRFIPARFFGDEP